jgi:ATP/maltotriose-dependent transcriptional regulator MalT
MTFFLHDNFDSKESFEPASASITSSQIKTSACEEFHLFAEKLMIPQTEGVVRRPRLFDMIDRSLLQFGATLLNGRSGTGKTALAADYARTSGNTAWYTVENADTDWNVFRRYFAASIHDALGSPESARSEPRQDGEVSKVAVAKFLADLFARVDSNFRKDRLIIILDDLHRIFDAPWFDVFFEILLYSLRENTQLLLLCRSRPPSPLWRLRSKQMLNVIDEKLLAFNEAETAEFFKSNGLSKKSARVAYAESFGRISKVLQLARSRR